MSKQPTAWEKCAEFHGHECMGLAIGFRQSFIAMEALGVLRAADEELVAVVETDACGVDAIQVLTGCTIGKGNLIYKDAGKQAMTLANRKTGKAVRVVMKPRPMTESERFTEIRDKISGGTATEAEKAEWNKLQAERIETFLNLPAEAAYTIVEVPLPQIEKARMFTTVICSQCGEPFSEGKASLAEGKVVCSDCRQVYSRGW
jgi:formylmethanofuran dehydrogenase subunit E